MRTDDTDIDFLGRCLLRQGQSVDTGHWQSLSGVPQTKTIELMNVRYELHLPQTMRELQDDTQCNLPWAEEQFQERIGGVPLNPGETYKKWPWYRGNVDQHRERCGACDGEGEVADHPCAPCRGLGYKEVEAKFSHTYMERFWPRSAGMEGPKNALEKIQQYKNMQGIRYRYGDLTDVVSLLAREPYTRQAYLPIFFPEDTGAHHGQRIPCTLGYHFLLREGKLHITYFIRSCDYLRHFRDDVYLAGRLCQWVLQQLKDQEVSRDPAYYAEHGGEMWAEGDSNPQAVVPGTLTMFISSLHIFEGDLPKMRRDYG